MKHLVPEDFLVDGSEKEEGAQPRIAKINENKKMKAHESRSRSEEYVSVKTGKIDHARYDVKPRCRHIGYEKIGRECSKFSEEERKEINKAFYATESLQLQREYIVRYVKQTPVKQRTRIDCSSRRSHTVVISPPKRMFADGCPGHN